MILPRAPWAVVLLACGAGEGQPDYFLLPLAGGTQIDKVSVYQGVEKVLYKAPGVFAFGSVPPPVFTARELTIRVAASAVEDGVPRIVVATAEWRSPAGDLSFGDILDLGEGWDDWNEESTAQFTVPRELVTADSELAVAIRDATLFDPVDGSTEDAIWTSEDGTPGGGLPHPLDVEAAKSIRLVLIPVRYYGDGTGRIPDTTPAQLARIEEKFLAMYPLSSIEVIVGSEMSWNSSLPASGGGWDGLLTDISAKRLAAGAPENTYYYGLFSPAKDFDSYCGGGCQLGLSLLAMTPDDTAAKASIGVGWTGEESIDTMLHEVGHAHGRDHAPCGTSGDTAFPYPGGGIGVWGWDRRTGEFLDPELYKDFMSYCGPIWSSDYNLNALHDRIVAVAALAGARAVRPTEEWESWIVRADGRATRHGRVVGGAPGGRAVIAARSDGAEAVSGTLIPFDHQPGGILWVSPVDAGVSELVVPLP